MKIDPERQARELAEWEELERVWWDEFRVRAYLMLCHQQAQESCRNFDRAVRVLENARSVAERALEKCKRDLDLDELAHKKYGPLLEVSVMRL